MGHNQTCFNAVQLTEKNFSKILDGGVGIQNADLQCHEQLPLPTSCVPKVGLIWLILFTLILHLFP